MLILKKKLKCEGYFPSSDFKEIGIVEGASVASNLLPCSGIEMAWDKDKLIRFSQVEQLVDFLKKVS